MAGKSNKSKNKSKPKAGVNASENNTEVAAEDSGAVTVETSDVPTNGSNEQENEEADAGMEVAEPGNNSEQQAGETEGDILDNAANGDSVDSNKAEGHSEGQLQLYSMAVKGPSGEHVELQVNPVDSVMDLRQFLLDAPETCFYTCYDLILRAADGTKHQLADFYEIGDVADVTSGGCVLEMVNGKALPSKIMNVEPYK